MEFEINKRIRITHREFRDMVILFCHAKGVDIPEYSKIECFDEMQSGAPYVDITFQEDSISES